MGSGGSQPATASLPPPPQPVIKYDPATSAAEAALAGSAKDSFASRTESEEDQQKKGQLGKPQAAPTSTNTLLPRKQSKAAASMMSGTGGGMGQSAVITG